MLSAIQPTQIQKNTPSLFRVGSASFSASISASMSLNARMSVISLTGDPRVDDGKEEVEDEVDQDDRDGHEQGDPLDDRVVVLVHPRDELVARPRHPQQEV